MKIFIPEENDLQKYSEWKQLWYPNLEELAKAEASLSSDNNTVTNITVQLGATAFLHCHVRNSNDRTIAGSEVRAKCVNYRPFLSFLPKSLSIN